MARTQIQYGSQGNDVLELQKLLNQNGYKLDEDGIFGEKTLSAVKEYQQKNNLSVDGIVGDNTWGALMGGYANTTNNTEGFKYDDFKYDDFKYDEFNYNKDFAYDKFKYDDFKHNDYKESDIVAQAQAALNSQLANKPGAYQSQWQTQLDDTINKILNREKFSYDLNGDALYQQYKDKYTQQAKMAMADAIGQASAMTGGFGNSYAQSVGQQMYAKEMQNLNDIVPELYAMAYDKYNQEGQDLYNQYAMLGDRENLDYGRYRDLVSDWLAERDYLTNRYESERDFDYSKYNNERDFAYNKYADDRNLAYNQYTNDRNLDYSKYVDDRNFAYNKYADDRNFSYDKYSADRNLAYSQYADDKNLSYNEYRNAIEDALKKEQFEYQKDRDSIADSQWQKEFEEAMRQYNESLAEDKRQYDTSIAEDKRQFDTKLTEDRSQFNATDNAQQAKQEQTNSSNISAVELPTNIVNNVQNYTTEQGQANYLANEVNKGNITQDEAVDILNQYGVTDLTNRTWEVVDDGGANLLGINRNAVVRDENGNEYKLVDLRKELNKTMTNKESNAYIKDLMDELGIK